MVLANRLSTNPNTKVLLVERGPLADSWASRVPLFSSDFASDGSRTMKRMSECQEELGRPIELYNGSVLGGSSRINQMLYTRGLPAEYDAWRDNGSPGWGWEDMKPYFMKSERATYDCNPEFHGTNGSSIMLLLISTVAHFTLKGNGAIGRAPSILLGFTSEEHTCFE